MIKVEKKTHIPGKCSACGAEIIFLLTGNNKLSPCNAESVAPGDKHFNYKVHVSHFATCPQSASFRKKPATPVIEKTKAQEEAEFKEDLEKAKEKIRNDQRPFIKHNKIEVTVPRYSLLNACELNGMEYDKLISYDNDELRVWLSQRDVIVKSEEELQLSLNMTEREQVTA